MTQTRDIILAGRTFAVPPLPLRVNRVVYPICRDLSAGDLVSRLIAANGSFQVCSDEEINDLAKIASLAAQAADPAMTEEAFDDLPVTPPELLDAFFMIRYQTGAWVPAQPPAPASEGDEPLGEAAGA